MKTYLIYLFLLVSISFTMAQNVSTKAPVKTTPEMTDTLVKYTCSMHPEVNSEKSGKCPKCGMDLIKKNAESQIVKSSFHCPMKCEGEKVYDKKGNCPKCGMDLEAIIPVNHKGHDHKSK